MTPGGIEILLHCHCCPAPHPRIGAPAVDQEIQSFLANGLIEPRGEPNCYQTTRRGAAHVEQLCSLAWPQPAWVNDRGEVIRKYDGELA